MEMKRDIHGKLPADIEVEQSMFIWGSKCRDCFNCKTRTFFDYDQLKEWVDAKGFHMRGGWHKIFLRNKKISVYWCIKNRNGRLKATNPDRGTKRDKTECWYIDNKEIEGEK